MKIYFAGAIRGGRDDADLYFQIIKYIGNYGEVLTEHVGSPELRGTGEICLTDMDIFQRDRDWLRSADVVVAEVSTPSLGVGYELGIAEKLKKPILCIYRTQEGNRLSAMVNGNKKFTCYEYQKVEEVKFCIRNYFDKLISGLK